uniref:laccase-2-like n=1 Tax=Styela clava TaxID=7725 RepID=UPI001939593C|nr:laccase-2-like [Styela clava]
MQNSYKTALASILTMAVITKTYVECSDSHPCNRECEFPSSPRLCEYNFTVEWYYTMSKACYNCPFTASDCTRPHCVTADGVSRPIAVVNRMFPGPPIRVCYQDTVRVFVDNQLVDDEGITIHWHGIYVKDTPWMDGVPMLTQCPIPAKTSFAYEFVANPPGTHFWHAHAGFQRSDGVAGSLIIDRPMQKDPHKDLYEIDSDEHIVFLTDWLHKTTLEKFLEANHYEGLYLGDNMLINGKGVFQEFKNEADNSTHFTPMHVFKVEKDNRYRFRIISNAIFCSHELTIDGHKMNVIASDGAEIEPYVVSSLVIHGGERFDFVMDASQEISNYWMRIQSFGACTLASLNTKAILRYQGASMEDPQTSAESPEDKIQLNNPFIFEENEKNIQLSSLKPVYSDVYFDSDRYSAQPDHTYFIGFDINMRNHPTYNDPDLYPFPQATPLFFPQLNNISFSVPSYPMLTRPKNIDESKFCNPESDEWGQVNSDFCKDDFCSCTHVIDAHIGEMIELVFYDEGKFPFVDAAHPMHLHGQHFAVVAMRRIGKQISSEEIREIHGNGSIEYNFNAIYKDSVIVSDGGYTVVRFLADNPGVWSLHCHLALHLKMGMELVIRVGSSGEWPTPPEDFPTCGIGRGKSDAIRTFSARSALLNFTMLILAASFYIIL